MMSVGRLVVFDTTKPETITAAKNIIETNELYSPEARAIYCPRIIVVGDIASI